MSDTTGPLDLACLYCGVAPGAVCVDPGGRALFSVHQIRQADYDQHCRTQDAIHQVERIIADPDAVSDSDKLRSVADHLDVVDLKLGHTGTDLQDFLRGLALRLEVA